MGVRWVEPWRGKEVALKVDRAAKSGIDATTEDAANLAQAVHPWSNESGDLQANIHNEGAKKIGGVWWGKFGSARYTTFYGLFLERKGRPFLRPAADATFHRLAENIRRRF